MNPTVVERLVKLARDDSGALKWVSTSTNIGRPMAVRKLIKLIVTDWVYDPNDDHDFDEVDDDTIRRRATDTPTPPIKDKDYREITIENLDGPATSKPAEKPEDLISQFRDTNFMQFIDLLSMEPPTDFRAATVDTEITPANYRVPEQHVTLILKLASGNVDFRTFDMFEQAMAELYPNKQVLNIENIKELMALTRGNVDELELVTMMAPHLAA
jgi:hypothetical protein